MAAVGGIAQLRRWGIEPDAFSGLLSMSPLASSEALAATGMACFTAKELQHGVLNERLLKRPAPQATHRSIMVC